MPVLPKGRVAGQPKPDKTTPTQTHLLEMAALGAHERHAVAVVDVGGDGGHSVAGLGVQRVARHQLGAAQGLVDVQPAERVVNGHGL